MQKEKRRRQSSSKHKKNNPKHFFNYAKRLSKINMPVGPLRLEYGQIIEDPKTICNMLTQQYKIVFSITDQENKIEKHEAFFQPSQRNQQVLLSDISLKNEDIIKAIGELKTNSAPGPDGVPTSLLLN